MLNDVRHRPADGCDDPEAWVEREDARMTLHIHAPQPTERSLHRLSCPTCERKTFMVSFFTEWYGWHSTCLKCGDQWEDGEMLERPFAPRWRKQSIEHAKKRWRSWEGSRGRVPV